MFRKLQSLGIDVLVYALAKASVMLSAFLVVKFLSERLTPAQYGQYGLIMASVVTIAILAGTFLATAILRFLPRAIENRRLQVFNYTITQLTQMAVAGSAGLCLLATFLFHTVGGIPMTPLLLASVVLANMAATLALILPPYFNAGRMRFRYSALLCIQTMGYLGLLWLFVGKFEDHLTTIFLALACSHMLSWLITRPKLGFVRSVHPETWRTLRKYSSYSLPMLLLHVSIQLNSTLDQYIIRYFHSSEQVGLYAANYVVAEKSVYGLTSLTALVALPLIYRQWEAGHKAQCYRAIWQLSFALLAMGLVMVVAVALWGEGLIAFLIAPAYAEGMRIFPYVMSGVVFSGIAAMIAEVFTLKERTLELALCYASATFVNLLLNLALVPSYAFMGSAYATLGTYLYLLVVVTVRAGQISDLFGRES